MRKRIWRLVHGDDFTPWGIEEDLIWIRDLMKSWFAIKVGGMLGPDVKDDKEVVILSRTVRRVGRDRIEYAADGKHRDKILEHFGMVLGTRALTSNGSKEQKETRKMNETWERMNQVCSGDWQPG